MILVPLLLPARCGCSGTCSAVLVVDVAKAAAGAVHLQPLTLNANEVVIDVSTYTTPASVRICRPIAE
jgi:hypothetical protein